MNKIIISAPLLKFTNNVKTLELSGDSYFNLYSNLTNLFPDLRRVTNELKTNISTDIWLLVDGKALPLDHIFLNPKKNATIVIVPLITGSGGDDFTGIAVGVALIAVGMMLAPFTGGLSAAAAIGAGALGPTAFIAVGTAFSYLGGALLSLGVGMVLSGVLSALNPAQGKPKTQQHDSSVRSDNDAFQGLTNTTSTNTAIPLISGHHRVAGQFIGGRIKTINHDRDTVISVSNYV